eukprot:10552784-Alexandrium_andersonii.AAC.1
MSAAFFPAIPRGLRWHRWVSPDPSGLSRTPSALHGFRVLQVSLRLAVTVKALPRLSGFAIDRSRVLLKATPCFVLFATCPEGDN